MYPYKSGEKHTITAANTVRALYADEDEFLDRYEDIYNETREDTLTVQQKGGPRHEPYHEPRHDHDYRDDSFHEPRHKPHHEPPHKPHHEPPHKPHYEPPHKPHHEPPYEHHHRPGNEQPGQAPKIRPPETIPRRDKSLSFADPRAIRRCVGNLTYVWLRNGKSNWMYPTHVGEKTITGYSWTKLGWAYTGFDLDLIDGFYCFG